MKIKGKRERKMVIMALFSLQKFLDFGTVALLFLFDKHCSIMK